MKSRALPIVLAAALLASGVLAGVLVFRAGPGEADDAPTDGSTVAAATAAGAVDLPAKAVGAVRQPQPGFLAAQAAGSEVALYDGPDATSATWSLPNPTHEGVPLSFSVIDRVGDRLHVRLPIRPNGSTAWVESAEVVSYSVPNRILIDLSDRQLTAFHGPDVLMQEPVAVGSSSTPTPIGEFYVDISLADPGGSYGAWMLSVAGFSDVLFDFGGGIGQIAIHGWSDESVIGQAVSNGCIRMPNGVIERLAPLAPVGTPVTIRA